MCVIEVSSIHSVYRNGLRDGQRIIAVNGKYVDNVKDYMNSAKNVDAFTITAIETSKHGSHSLKCSQHLSNVETFEEIRQANESRNNWVTLWTCIPQIEPNLELSNQSMQPKAEADVIDLKSNLKQIAKIQKPSSTDESQTKKQLQSSRSNPDHKIEQTLADRKIESDVHTFGADLQPDVKAMVPLTLYWSLPTVDARTKWPTSQYVECSAVSSCVARSKMLTQLQSLFKKEHDELLKEYEVIFDQVRKLCFSFH